MMLLTVIALSLMLLTKSLAFEPPFRTNSFHSAVHPIHDHHRDVTKASASKRRSFQTFMSNVSSSISNTENSVSLQLTKPFGMMLEEIEGSRGGVQVTDVGETGSAVPYADQIRNTQIITINDVDVRQYDFDQMMTYIGTLPSDEVVTMEFQKPKEPLKIGTPVTIKVMTSNGDTIPINAKVGENLRQTLLSNNIEVYQGMQKLSNCGGAGQCSLCAFDFIESTDNDEWEERSDYESNKLKKFPSARLTCLNNIQGPATIRKTQR
jgi:ferredoxin